MHATTRTPGDAGPLADLVAVADVHLHACDVNAPRAGVALADSLLRAQPLGHGNGAALDVVIYNAGINQPAMPLGRAGEGEGFSDSAVMFTNAIAPFMLLEHLLPLMRGGGCKLGLVSSDKASRAGGGGHERGHARPADGLRPFEDGAERWPAPASANERHTKSAQKLG